MIERPGYLNVLSISSITRVVSPCVESHNTAPMADLLPYSSQGNVLGSGCGDVPFPHLIGGFLFFVITVDRIEIFLYGVFHCILHGVTH